MCKSIQLQSQVSESPATRKSLSRCMRTPLAVLAAAAALFGAQTLLAGQSTATQTHARSHPSASARRAVHRRTRSGAAHPKTSMTPASTAPVTPPAPKPPIWPANERPSEASVTWDSHGLRVDAANSSLQQILKDVSTATGVKVEGMNEDVRVFGSYGPGPARDVLSQLLHGSGYNVMMIGDQGQGTPRQIVLSARSTGSAPTPSVANAATSNEDEAADNETEEQPQPPAPAVRPNIPPANQTRTPQQIMEEMRERQQQVHSQNPPPD